MENYFSGYETEIHFTEADDPLFERRSMSHRGRVYGIGKSGVYKENKHSLYLDLEIGSNPELTAHIALVGAGICAYLSQENEYGAYTLFDIPPSVICKIMDGNVNKYL